MSLSAALSDSNKLYVLGISSTSASVLDQDAGLGGGDGLCAL